MKEISENNLKDRIDVLEEQVTTLQSRNLKVEADKVWETSFQRKILVAVITYIVVVIIMYVLNIENAFVNALIPTLGFLLSTLSINFAKKMYIEKYINKGGM